MTVSRPNFFLQKSALLTDFFKRLADNPIIIKELRGKMRSRRAFTDLTIYLLLISSLVFVIYFFFQDQVSNGHYEPQFRQTVGKTIFSVVMVVELLMIGFIGPSLTAGAITGERERNTYDLLRTTLISARMLVIGKLLSACSYLFLLIFAVTPIQALVFLLGGVGPEEIFVSTLILLVNIVFFCALGLFCSSFTKRTLTATILSYSSILVSLLATGLMFYGLAVTSSSSSNLSAILIFYFCSINSLLTSIVSETLLIDTHIFFYGQFNGIDVISPWVLHIPLVAIFSAIMILLSILLVNRVER